MVSVTRVDLRALKRCTVATFAVALIAAAGASPSGAAHSPTTYGALAAMENAFPAGAGVSEAGSNLLLPLMQAWVGHGPATHLAPSDGGSGLGQQKAEHGEVNVGGSDLPAPPVPSGQTPVLNVPLVVAAEVVSYNLPGVAANTHLRLNGNLLARIYAGQVTMWNDGAIAALNPGVTLPHRKIVPLHRDDGSGDTATFSTYIYDQDPTGFVTGVGQTSLPWPQVAGAIGAIGNAGIVDGCGQHPGCIAYESVSFLPRAEAKGLGEAAMRNGRAIAQYEMATPPSIDAEARAYVHGGSGISTIDLPHADGGYPLVSLEYGVVQQWSNEPSTSVDRGFLAWAMDPRHGASPRFIDPLHFRPLPFGLLSYGVALLKSIGPPPSTTSTTQSVTSSTQTTTTTTTTTSALPAVTGVSPTSATYPSTVTISGSNLSGATVVNFGTHASPSFSFHSGALTAEVPCVSMAQLHVTVVTPAGTSTPMSADLFTIGNCTERLPLTTD